MSAAAKKQSIRGARVEFHPATAERWRDVQVLFGPRGACAGCWCQWPRLRGAEYGRGRGEPNKRALRKQVTSGVEPGIVAYVNGEPAGWCALAPREGYPRITHSRLFGGDDAEPGTWSVVCFFVARPFRGQRLTVKLLDAAAKHAKARGARWIEGYPVDPKSKNFADTFAWVGFASTFRAAGFEEVARPSPTRPLMRKKLGRGTASPRAGAGGAMKLRVVPSRPTTAGATKQRTRTKATRG